MLLSRLYSSHTEWTKGWIPFNIAVFGWGSKMIEANEAMLEFTIYYGKRLQLSKAY